MLEYLSHRKVFYPHYPSIELQDLREACNQLQHYQVLAHGLARRATDLDDIIYLSPKSLLAVIDDPVICNSWVLAGLLDVVSDAEHVERILHRMRTWEDFDWGALEEIIADPRRKVLPWYPAVCDIYFALINTSQASPSHN